MFPITSPCLPAGRPNPLSFDSAQGRLGEGMIISPLSFGEGRGKVHRDHHAWIFNLAKRSSSLPTIAASVCCFASLLRKISLW